MTGKPFKRLKFYQGLLLCIRLSALLAACKKGHAYTQPKDEHFCHSCQSIPHQFFNGFGQPAFGQEVFLQFYIKRNGGI